MALSCHLPHNLCTAKELNDRTTEWFIPQVTFYTLTDYIVQSIKIQIRTNIKFTSTDFRRECLYKDFCFIFKNVKINVDIAGTECWSHHFTKFPPLLAWKVKGRKSCYRVNTWKSRSCKKWSRSIICWSFTASRISCTPLSGFTVFRNASLHVVLDIAIECQDNWQIWRICKLQFISTQCILHIKLCTLMSEDGRIAELCSTVGYNKLYLTYVCINID